MLTSSNYSEGIELHERQMQTAVDYEVNAYLGWSSEDLSLHVR